jgi:hypothetical protein
MSFTLRLRFREANGIDSTMRHGHNRSMVEMEPRMRSRGSKALTLAQFAVVAVFSLMIGGAITACTRRSADPDQFARDKVFADAVRKLQADLEAKRVAAEVQKQRDQAAVDDRANALPPLLEAARYADAKEVKALLPGSDRKILNEALLLVSRSEPLTVNDRGEEAKTASLPYAAIARLLLDKGANLEVRDKHGATPLLYAAGYGETAVVKLFLERGANIEETNSDGRTALIAAACNCPIIDMPDTADSVRLLLKNGADIEARDKQGETALIAAAAWGRAWIVKILLDSGAQIEARNNEGYTPLLISAQGQALLTADTVQALLGRGADIEARNNKGKTALMLASSSGGAESVKIVKILLKRGADLRVQDPRGRTAYDMAVAKGHTEVASLLRAATKSR